MATTRTFGATDGSAGPIVEQTTPDPSLEDGPLGTTIYIGRFPRGPIGVCLEMELGRPDFRRIFGEYGRSHALPVIVEDDFGFRKGAGTVWCMRVATEDAGRRAFREIRNRNPLLGVSLADNHDQRDLLFTVRAGSEGRWAGRKQWMGGKIASTAAFTGADEVDLSFPTDPVQIYDENEWVRAELRFPLDLPNESFAVKASTVAGVITVRGQFPESLRTSASLDGRWTLQFADNRSEVLDVGRQSVAVRIDDAVGQSPSDVECTPYLDGSILPAFVGTVHPESPANLLNQLSQLRQWELEIVNGDTDGWLLHPVHPRNMPANFAEIPQVGGVTARTVKFQVVRISTEGAHDAYVDTVRGGIVKGSGEPVEGYYELTFDGAGGFDIQFVPSMQQTGSIFGAPSLWSGGGSIGTAVPSALPELVGFTVKKPAGSADPANGTKLFIHVNPLPADLAALEAYLYPAATGLDGDPDRRFRIVSSDWESVTITPVADLTTLATAPGAASIDAPTGGPYDLSAGGLTFKYSCRSSGGDVTLVTTLSGAAETTAALAADLNTLEETRAGAAEDVLVRFEDADGALQIVTRGDYGDLADLRVADGTMNSVLGFDPAGTAVVQGDTPTVARLSWRQELGDGADPDTALSSGDVQAYVDLEQSPLNATLPENTGVVKIAAPELPDAAAAAAIALWAYENNAYFYPTIPGEVDELGALAWINATFGADARIGSVVPVHPSRVPTRRTIGSQPETIFESPVVGAVLGMEAALARKFKGFHQAAAGEEANLSSFVLGIPNWAKAAGSRGPMREGLLNQGGIRPIRKKGSRFYVYGDRIRSTTGTGTVFLHKMLTVSHISRILLTNTGRLDFTQISERGLANARRLVRGLFRPWWLTGWFSDVRGADFAQAVDVKADRENNTAETEAAGKMVVDTSFVVVGTAENVLFRVGEGSVSQQT